MKLLIFIATALSIALAAAAPRGDFYLEVTIVTGEHSRDSNSITHVLTVSSGELVYKETYAGARSGRRTPSTARFKLTKEDRETLISLLKTKRLLVTKTISKPPTQKGFSRYFQIAITSALDGKEYSVAIDASPSAQDLKTDSLYQGSVGLIEQLYKIINRTNADIRIPTLIE